MTEKEKMLAGQIYDYTDPEIQALQKRAYELVLKINNLSRYDENYQQNLNELIPNLNGAFINNPLRFEYGFPVYFGKNCFVNFNFTALDSAPITIGDNVLIGPNVTLATPVHPMVSDERRPYVNEKGLISDKEYALPIVIGNDVWIASNVTVCGGVTIGEGTVIGAGSVVIKDIPANVFAAGNPCKVIRKITEEDRLEYRLKK